MDPITAAGIGLSITSLLLQVFAGCLKGYQLFSEVEGMPGAYQHLRMRLRIEQTRLLNWGQNVGLVEGMLEKPSRSLEMNRNIILDILLEIQSTFKACMKIASHYDSIAPNAPPTSGGSAPNSTQSLLRKTLAVLEKTPQLSARLQWAMVKKDDFSQLIDKLIRYNDTIESFLDKAALDQLQLMQQRTYMMILQLTDKVDELKDLSHALQIRAPRQLSKFDAGLSRASTLKDHSDDYDTAVRLADFKVRQNLTGLSSHNLKIHDLEAMRLMPNGTGRPGVVYQGKHGWVEWKSWDKDENPNSSWNTMIEGRVNSLVNLLSSKEKPKEFRAPRCLGYFDDQAGDHDRFGLVYENSLPGLAHAIPISLRELLASRKRPSLNKRLGLGHAIAESLMYLHSVNWLHKGVRSNNILCPLAVSQEENNSLLPEYHPVLSGFDYARPDLPDSMTERSSPILEHELYRHPDLTSLLSNRSKKSHDIYSLGIVLVEIAFWQPIEDIVLIELGQKGATRRVRQIRELLLSDENGYLALIDGHVGETYRQVVRRCLVGGLEIGIPPNGDESDPHVGVEMQRVFLEEIVSKLAGIRV